MSMPNACIVSPTYINQVADAEENVHNINFSKGKNSIYSRLTVYMSLYDSLYEL